MTQGQGGLDPRITGPASLAQSHASKQPPGIPLISDEEALRRQTPRTPPGGDGGGSWAPRCAGRRRGGRNLGGARRQSRLSASSSRSPTSLGTWTSAWASA